MQMPAIAHGDFMIRDIMQLVMHVTHRIDMNQGRDERHHAEHADGQRIDVVTDTQPQVAELTEHPRAANRGCSEVVGVVNRHVGMTVASVSRIVIMRLNIWVTIRVWLLPANNDARLRRHERRVTFSMRFATGSMIRKPDRQRYKRKN